MEDRCTYDRSTIDLCSAWRKSGDERTCAAQMMGRQRLNGTFGADLNRKVAWMLGSDRALLL